MGICKVGAPAGARRPPAAQASATCLGPNDPLNAAGATRITCDMSHNALYHAFRDGAQIVRGSIGACCARAPFLLSLTAEALCPGQTVGDGGAQSIGVSHRGETARLPELAAAPCTDTRAWGFV